MRLLPLTGLSLVLAIANPSAGWAGLYYSPQNKALWPREYAFSPPQGGYQTKEFRSLLNDLRTLAVDRVDQEGRPVKNSLRQSYLDRAAELAAKGSTLTVAERLELSVCQMRLLKAEEALTTLRAAEAAEPHNFMVLANLATAHQMTNLLDRAVFYQEQTLANWPQTQEGFTPNQLRWYRRVEKYHLLLMQQRHREEQAQPGKTADDVDSLFPKFKFQNSKDAYQASQISPILWAELPGDAIPIVQQLLIWMPHDNRLYWLLAELLNAKGDSAAAKDVLDDLVFGRRYTPTVMLRQHLQILQETKPTQPELAVEAQPSPTASPAASSAPATGNWLPDWRHILVGFVMGCIVTALAQMQWREMARRRQLNQSAKPPQRV